jgi:hypothetical protein
MSSKKIIFEKITGKLLLLCLLPVFFVWHGYNENFGLITTLVAIKLVIYYLAITVIVFIASFLFYREKQKAFVFSFFCLSLFFFFGSLYDTLKSLFAGYFITSYTFLLPFLLCLFIFIFFFIKKLDKWTALVSFYLKWLVFAFVFFEGILTIYFIITDKNSKNILLSPYKQARMETMGDCDKERPDIFFIVLDEYTSSEGLAKYFGLNNHRIDSLFKSEGFFVSSGSRSNYNMTVFSLSSTLNYDYLDLKKSDSVFSNTTLLKGIETFKKNRLTPYLADLGYEIINYGCFDLKNAVTPTYPFFNYLPKDMIDNQTFYSRITRDIGWKYRITNVFTKETRISISYNKTKREHLFRNSFNADNLLNEMSRRGDRPRFIYAHLILPHDPYYFDSSGNFVSDTLLIQKKFNDENAYINQLKYCNKILEKMISASVLKTGRERVVVIEGDHGHGYHDKPALSEIEFSNLNAYFFSDKNYQALYPTISPVNTFRIILNKYFCENLPLLKDSSFFMLQKK